LDWENNPFEEIEILCGEYDGTTLLKSILRSKSSLRSIDTIFNKTLRKNENKVFIFNDERVEGQFAMYLNSKNNGVNIYVEDGSAVYNRYIRRDTRSYIKSIYKLIYGHWYEYVRILGTSKSSMQILVFRPELIRFELQNKEIKKIPSTLFMDIDKKLITSLLVNYNVHLEKEMYECILILPFSKFTNEVDAYIFDKVYTEIVSVMLNVFKSIGVKYHPREKNERVFTNYDNEKIKIIPNSLPIEIFWTSLISNPPKIVVGDISTSLLTCELVLKSDTIIISTMKMLNLPEKYDWSCIYESFGIRMPKTIDEFKLIIE